MIINQLLNEIEKAESFDKKMYIATKLVNEVNDIIEYIATNEVEKIDWKLSDLGIEVRICTNCGKLMFDGYVVNDGDEYYCSDTCFDEEIGMENLYKMYEDEEAYYTQFN